MRNSQKPMTMLMLLRTRLYEQTRDVASLRLVLDIQSGRIALLPRECDALSPPDLPRYERWIGPKVVAETGVLITPLIQRRAGRKSAGFAAGRALQPCAIVYSPGKPLSRMLTELS